MPLRRGKDSISYNISKLMEEWKETGMISGEKITTRKEALRKATAIALSLANEKPKKAEE